MKRQHENPAQAESARVRACQPGASAAVAPAGSVEDLFHQFSEPLKRYGIGLGFLPEQAEEAVQESFLRLQSAVVRQEQIHNPAAFLHTVVRHLLIDSARLSRRADSYTVQVRRQSKREGGAGGANSEDLLRLASALLSRREGEVLDMRRNGQSYEEISIELGISRGTVGALVSRAMAKIRQLARRAS